MSVATSDEVRRLLGVILEHGIGDGDNPSRSSEPKWDSLKHVELVFLLEDHFGIHFTPDDLMHMGDLREVTRTVEAHIAA
jgi:acyl carrier protein